MLSRLNWRKVIIVTVIISLTPLLFLQTSQIVSADTKSRFEKLELFNKILFLVESQYYREVDTSVLIEGAIKGMMSTLDPHSAFLDSEVFSKVQEDTRGEFGGLGLEVSQKDGIIIVVTPIDDTPAFKAGIKAGDRIVEIDGESTMGTTLEEAVEKMRGKPGAPISVGIVREGVEGVKTYTIKRQIIKVEPVKAELVNDNYLFVRLTQFQKDSAVAIERAIKKFQKQNEKKGGIKGIVLDLRSNPGGLLDEAVNVSSLFLSDGVVVSTEGRDPQSQEIRYVKKSGFKNLEIPIVVLINGASASASEMVAGALQDHNRAIIMGSRSFGKGSVQTVAKINEDQGVKLTIAQYMTPTGKKIQAVGIVPDVDIPEAEGRWVKEQMYEGRYVREKDLRNHLTATIETEQEKSERLEQEKQERIERIQKMERARQQKSAESQDSESRAYTAQEDYQVQQAVRFLQSFEVFQKIQKRGE
jgi:carboxyl-terminal processing protease